MSEKQKKKFMTPAKIAFVFTMIAIFCLSILLFKTSRTPRMGVFSLLAICSGMAFILGLISLLGKSKENKSLAVVSIVVSVIIVYIAMPGLSKVNGGHKIVCGTNLRGLGTAMQIYAHVVDEDKKYPTPSKWCDSLAEHVEVGEKSFKCPIAKRSENANRSYYAMNPNCEPNFPPETVLLFETKGGWNQFGGAELLSAENHKEERCNILFNDRSVEFVKKEHFGELKWK